MASFLVFSDPVSQRPSRSLHVSASIAQWRVSSFKIKFRLLTKTPRTRMLWRVCKLPSSLSSRRRELSYPLLSSGMLHPRAKSRHMNILTSLWNVLSSSVCLVGAFSYFRSQIKCHLLEKPSLILLSTETPPVFSVLTNLFFLIAFNTIWNQFNYLFFCLSS